MTFEEQFPSIDRKQLQEWFMPINLNVKELRFDDSTHMVGMSQDYMMEKLLDKQRVREVMLSLKLLHESHLKVLLSGIQNEDIQKRINWCQQVINIIDIKIKELGLECVFKEKVKEEDELNICRFCGNKIVGVCAINLNNEYTCEDCLKKK